MAELITKKSSKIVSSNSNMKNNDVCSVQSNNGLIDLDNITASNNQLITLCDETEDDDDLIMTRNTKNELSPDDKSLQEMIESEFALRINSVNENDDLIEDEEEDASLKQPEVTIKKIIIEPRPDPLDINAEFIGAEMEHYTIVEDPYTYRNGHASPGFVESRSPETVNDEMLTTIGQCESKREEDFVDPSSIDDPIDVNTTNKRSIDGPSDEFDDSRNVRPDYDIVEDEIIVQSESEPIWSNSMDNFISNKVSGNANSAEEQSLFDDDLDGMALKLDKHRQEENDPRDPAWLDSEEKMNDKLVSSEEQKSSDFPGVWLDPVVPGDTSLGQFSDDFEGTSGREKKCPEVEEPQDHERQDFQVRTDIEEHLYKDNAGENLVDLPVVDADDLIDTDSKIYSEVIANAETHSDSLAENIVDVDPLIEESEKISGSCVSTDSSQIEVLPIREMNFDSRKNDENPTDIKSNVQCFINEESRSLVHEKDETIEHSETTIKPEATNTETKINEKEVNEDAEKNVPVFTEDVKSYAVTEHPEENEEREESSWMTVEEATNDRNKLAETINELNTLEGKNDITNESKSAMSNGSFEKDESHANTGTSSNETILATAKMMSTTTTIKTTTTTTTNGLADGLSVADPEINFIPDEDEDDSSSCNPTKIDSSSLHDDTTTCLLLSNSAMLAPLATPDDEISEFSNLCDNESREEVITSSSIVVNSTTSAKSSTKTKKKKIEGVAGNDASPTLTPRTKKTKKSKKSDLEKENISVVGQNGDANPNCRSCGKVVFQMEQTKAEGLVWHKNCFRCVQCSKQLSVDNYQSHESTLYCKAHFKELFQPKPVEESDQPVRPRKPEMIIRENQPKELPPDVVRASDKPDLGLEELSALNVKSRFQVFEKTTNDTNNEIERSPSQVVKRSPSILSKLAKFQAKGMDIGVADDSLNGIPYEESSESEEEEEIEDSEDMDNEIVKAKRTTRERPISFTKMDDIKNRWECTSQQGRRESQREARKEEIAGIRSRLFMGKQGKMKEMYQQAVAESERITKTNPTEEIQHSTHARSIKERFERGEPIAPSDGEAEANKLKQEKPDEEVIAAGISRKSRSLFLELDASAAKTGRPVTPVNPKTPTDVSRRARDMSSPDREIYRDPDVVRADDRVNEVVRTDTARKMLSIFRQMEEKATKEDIPDGPKPLKCFTPPPEDKFAKATASASEDEEDEEGEETEDDESAEERDPNYVRASDKVEDEFLKQAKNAARAKTLRAKFEQWETTDGKVASHHVAEMDMAQGNGDQASIESASSLRARFESLGSQPAEAPRAQKVKVNRFV